MQITCAATDEPRFKALGFHVVEREGALVTLEDPEANYAHDGSLPIDIVYEGHHSPGGCFEGAQCACDGKEFALMPAGMDGGVIVVLTRDGKVQEDDLNRWLKLMAVLERALPILESLRHQPAPDPTPLDLSPLLQRAAEAGACDEWLAEKLHRAAQSWVGSIRHELPRELTDDEQEQLILAFKDGYLEPSTVSQSETQSQTTES